MQELSSMYSELGISKEVLEYGKKIEEKLKERFENLNLKLECDIYKWDCCFKYEDNKYYKENQNKIIKLKKEKSQLLLTLENNSKTSNEYKKAINDFIKKVK